MISYWKSWFLSPN